MKLLKYLYKILFGTDDGWYGKKDTSVPIRTQPTPTIVIPIATPQPNPKPNPKPNSNVSSHNGPTGVSNSLLWSSPGITGLSRALLGPTGVQLRSFNPWGFGGATGFNIAPTLSEDEWENPVVIEGAGTVKYQVKGILHCAFGPASVYTNFFKDKNELVEDWYIKGSLLTDDQVSEIKEILNDIKKAPLYLNHDVFKYTAKHVLKKVGE